MESGLKEDQILERPLGKAMVRSLDFLLEQRGTCPACPPKISLQGMWLVDLRARPQWGDQLGGCYTDGAERGGAGAAAGWEGGDALRNN